LKLKPYPGKLFKKIFLLFFQKKSIFIENTHLY